MRNRFSDALLKPGNNLLQFCTNFPALQATNFALIMRLGFSPRSAAAMIFADIKE